MTIEPAITIAEFTKRYDAARERLTDFVYDLAEAQLSKTHDAAGWAVKDHLIHLAVWQNGMTALLRGQPRFAAMGVSDAQGKSSDYDTTNDIIFKQHRHLSSGEAMEMFDKADTEFWEVFETLSDADLIKPYAHFAPSAPDTQEPVIGWLVGNTFGHFDEHLPWMRDIAARRINVTTGTRWEEEVGIAARCALALWPRWLARWRRMTLGMWWAAATLICKPHTFSPKLSGRWARWA